MVLMVCNISLVLVLEKVKLKFDVFILGLIVFGVNIAVK